MATNLEIFGKVYTEQLHLAVASHPEEYIFTRNTLLCSSNQDD